MIFLAAYLWGNSQDTILDSRINFPQRDIVNSKTWVDTIYSVRGKVIGYRHDTAFFNSTNRIVSYRRHKHMLDSISKSYSSQFFYTPDGYSKAIYYPLGATSSPFAYFYFKNGHPIRQFDPDKRFSLAGVSSEVAEKRRMTFDGMYYFNWVEINKNRVQMLSVTDQQFPETYFKKDSLVIRVPGKLEKDFRNLFETLPSAFDSIYFNCRGIRRNFLDETMEHYFEQVGARYIVYFDSRKVKEEQGEVIWIMTSRAGQWHECYPNIYLRKHPSKKSKEVKSITVRNGTLCQI